MPTMKSYDVRVFEVPRAKKGEKFEGHGKHKPKELSPATVQCGNTDKGKKLLRARFEKEGREVRGIQTGPNDRTGQLQFIVYLHGAEV